MTEAGSIAGFAPSILGGVALVMLLAGAVKGFLGLGITFVAAPMMTLFIGVPEMVTLLALPILLSNIWQAFAGGFAGESWRRLWSLILCLGVGTFIGARLLYGVDANALFVLLGALVSGLAIMGLAGLAPHVPVRWQGTAGPVVGFAAGVVGGMTAMFGPVITAYVAHLGLDKNRLVSATALIYVASGAFLFGALTVQGAMTGHAFAASAIAAVPVIVGTTLGDRLRRRAGETLFTKILLIFLLLLGLNMLRRAF
jgi:uncharacterized membrane protein YfcA